MPDRSDIVFRARGLTKVYRNGALEVHALRGIDFTARKGEFIVILGPAVITIIDSFSQTG